MTKFVRVEILEDVYNQFSQRRFSPGIYSLKETAIKNGEIFTMRTTRDRNAHILDAVVKRDQWRYARCEYGLADGMFKCNHCQKPMDVREVPGISSNGTSYIEVQVKPRICYPEA